MSRSGYNWVMLGLCIALCLQGLFNFAFRGTPLESWKQLAVCAACGLVVLHGDWRAGPGLSIFVPFATALLVAASLAMGIAADQAAFTMFSYVSWLPFLFWGASPATRKFIAANHLLFLAVIAVSAAGLATQLFTRHLDFLIDDVRDLQFRLSTHQARRLYFVFVASTIVLPSLAACFVLFVVHARSALLKIAAFMLLCLAAVTAGSLAGAIMVLCCLAILLVNLQWVPRLAFCLALLVCLPLSQALVPDIMDRQFERILNNDETSESNTRRLQLWAQAADTIGRFDAAQHVAGLGLGVTNLGRYSAYRVPHGESSFFQAYIEAGLFGLALRLLPFLLVFPAFAGPFRLERALYMAALLLACAVAPIYPAIGLQALFGLIVGLGLGPRKPAETASPQPTGLTLAQIPSR